MRAVLRRERRRRNGTKSRGSPLPLPHNALVEHVDLLSPVARYAETRFLISADVYLAEGLRHSPAPLSHYRIYTGLEEGFAAAEQIAPQMLVVELEGWDVPALAIMERIRSLQTLKPDVEIAIISAEQSRASLHFILASCRCQIVDKRQGLQGKHDMMQLTFLSTSQPERLFNPKEWHILMLIARGNTLRSIATLYQRPYHWIIYRLGRILALLGLSERQQLIRLLQQINTQYD